MKLLVTIIIGVLAAGLSAGSAQAQDAPTTPTPTTAPAASGNPAAPAPVDKAAAREALTSSIVQETNIPNRQDTGWGGDGGLWMPTQASAQAVDSDFLFWFIMWVTVIFTAIIVVVMTWFLIRYRARSEDEPDPVGVPSHSTSLEITWTVIPTCIVLVMFTLGFRGFLSDVEAPPSAYKVDVLAQTWFWNFTYPNGAQTPDLHLAVDRPVQFSLKSADVIHSLFVPAFRMKKDVVPGRYNTTWITPTKTGVYELFCTEYCGQSHSEMNAKVYVYPADQYDDVLAELSDLWTVPFTGQQREPAAVGTAIYAARGCQGCHSLDGSIGTGPTWKNLYGYEQPMSDGTTILADDNYIRESIYYPQQHIHEGFGNAMQSYLGQLSERDVGAVIAYMKTLSDRGGEPRVVSDPDTPTTPDGE